MFFFSDFDYFPRNGLSSDKYLKIDWLIGYTRSWRIKILITWCQKWKLFEYVTNSFMQSRCRHQTYIERSVVAATKQSRILKEALGRMLITQGNFKFEVYLNRSLIGVEIWNLHDSINKFNTICIPLEIIRKILIANKWTFIKNKCWWKWANQKNSLLRTFNDRSQKDLGSFGARWVPMIELE